MVPAACTRLPAFVPRRDALKVARQPCARVVVLLVLALVGGCAGRPPLEATPYSAAEAAQRAVQQYDKNGNGSLDPKELEQCPALLGLLNELDNKEEKSGSHKAGLLRAEEIQTRLEEFQASKAAMVDVACRVKLDGEPLEGASVTLTPEEFMGPSFKPARGVSNAQGNVRLVTEGFEAAGVAPGYYRIEVSKKDAGGSETLPSQFNQRSLLGSEISPLRRGGMVLKLELSSS
jgi:hypothetical protein